MIDRESGAVELIREKRLLAKLTGAELSYGVVLDSALCDAFADVAPMTGHARSNKIYWPGMLLAKVAATGRYSYYLPTAVDGRGDAERPGIVLIARDGTAKPAVAEWTKEKIWKGNWAVKLNGGGAGSWVAAAVPYGQRLDSIKTIDTFVQLFYDIFYTFAAENPYIELQIDTTGDGLIDAVLCQKGSGSQERFVLDEWLHVHGEDSWDVFGYNPTTHAYTSPYTIDGVSYPSTTWKTLTEWLAVSAAWPAFQVIRIAIGNSAKSHDAYVGGLSVNGIDFPIEPDKAPVDLCVLKHDVNVQLGDRPAGVYKANCCFDERQLHVQGWTPTDRELITALGVANADLKYTNKLGKFVQIKYTRAGPTGTTAVARTGSGTFADPYVITVSFYDDDDAASNVITIIEADADSAAAVAVVKAPDNDGTGEIIAMDATFLGGDISLDAETLVKVKEALPTCEFITPTEITS